jgi:hypothetical protein
MCKLLRATLQCVLCFNENPGAEVFTASIIISLAHGVEEMPQKRYALCNSLQRSGHIYIHIYYLQ